MAAHCCARKVWVSGGKFFVMCFGNVLHNGIISALAMSCIVTGSEMVQASDMYADFAQRDLASVVHSYSS